LQLLYLRQGRATPSTVIDDPYPGMIRITLKRSLVLVFCSQTDRPTEPIT